MHAQNVWKACHCENFEDYNTVTLIIHAVVLQYYQPSLKVVLLLADIFEQFRKMLTKALEYYHKDSDYHKKMCVRLNRPCTEQMSKTDTSFQ